MGLPVTFLVDLIARTVGFRYGFITECYATVLSVVCLGFGAHNITVYEEFTCRLTAPKLWNIFYWSVIGSWTLILIFSGVMFVASASLLLCPLKDSSRLPVIQSGTKTIYGTL
jgi:hypothetical protein